MKFAAALLLGTASATLTPTEQKALSITEGFVKGALDAEGFDDIEKCIKDGETLVSDSETAFTDFKKRDVKDVIAGLEAVGAGIKAIEAGLQDCGHLKDDAAKIETIIETFTSPTAFAYHVGKDLLVNGVDIYHEIDGAVTDYEKQDWFNFGTQIGMASVKIFLGQEKPKLVSNNKQKIAEMMQGVIETYGGHFDITALLECIEVEDQAALMVDAAVQSFEAAYEKKDLQDVIGGVIAVVAAIQQAKQGLPACEAVDTTSWNYAELNKCMDIAIHPTDHFSLIANDLTVHGKSIIEDVGTGVLAYKKGDYKTFGLSMGNIIKLTTEESIPENLFLY